MGKKHHHRQHIRKKGLPPGSLVYTGDRPAQPPEVLSVWYDGVHHERNETYHPEWQERENGVTWVDIRNLSDASFISRVGEDFGIHPLALEDVLNTQQRAKLDEYDNGLFFVLPHIKFNAGDTELSYEQIAMFVGHNFLVSFQDDPDDTFALVHQRVVESGGKIRKKGSDYLAYILTDWVVDHYFSVLDEIDVQVLDIESDLHTQGATQYCKNRIFQYKYVISRMKNRVQPLRDAVVRLMRADSTIVEDSNLFYLRDLTDHISQVLDDLDNQRDMLANLDAIYQAEIGNRMNNVMKLLTVISTIFMPLSFIAGLYGMNFDNMPELHWRWGYFIVLGCMFTILCGMLWYFRKKRWI